MSQSLLIPEEDRLRIVQLLNNIGEASDEYPQIFDLATFLRGPDFLFGLHLWETSKLKEYTVERVRAILGLRVGRSEILNSREIEERDRLLSLASCWENGHFLDHWRWALLAIRDVFHWDLLKETEFNNTCLPVPVEAYRSADSWLDAYTQHVVQLARQTNGYITPRAARDTFTFIQTNTFSLTNKDNPC